MANAVHPLAVDAGLVGSDHSGKDRRAVEVLADVLRAFVDTEEESDPVAGAVAEVAVRAPERVACQHVQLAARRTAREHRLRQVDMPLQHEGIILLLQHRAGPQGDGAGDVGRAVHILPTAVHEVQPARLQYRGVLARGDVVRKRGPLAEGGDCLEAVTPVPGYLRAERTELAGGAPFGHRAAATDGLVQPVEEALHRHAVLDVDVPHPLNLDRILDGLAECHGRLPFEDRALGGIGFQYVIKIVIQRRRIDCQPLNRPVFHLAGQGERHVVIVQDIDAVVLKLLETVAGILVDLAALPDEPLDGLHRDQQIGNDQRIVLYVGAADVQEPGYLVECCEQDRVAAGGRGFAAQPADAAPAVLARQIGAQRDDGGLRDGRTVLPEVLQHIRNGNYAEAVLVGRALGATCRREGGFQAVDGADALAEAVDGDNDAAVLGRQLVAGQPFRYQHLLRDTGLVQDDAAAFQLPDGLDEVSRVGPEPGVRGGDDYVAGLAGEPRQPLHLLPSRSRVLATVRIRSGDDHGVPAPLAHQRTQGFDPFPVNIFHTIQLLSR